MSNFAIVLSEAEALVRRSVKDKAHQMHEQQTIEMARREELTRMQMMPSQMLSVNGRQNLYSDPMMSYYYSTLGGLRGLDARESGKRVVGRIVDEPSREMLERVAVTVPEIDLNDPRTKLATEAEALLGYTPLRKVMRTPGTLKRVLAKLEITILDEASVNRYKAQMVEHLRTSNKMQMPTWRLTQLKEYTQPVPEFVLMKACQIKRELPEAEFYIDQLAVDPFLIVSMSAIKDYANNMRSRELDAETQAYVEVWAEPKFEAEL